MNDMQRAEIALAILAARDGITVDEVRASIQEAILAAQKNAAPQAQLLWCSMTKSGELPSPEELIIWGRKASLARRASRKSRD